MAKRTHTYAVRLAVEDGGKTKAELVSAGQKGERSLKRIGGAGAKASRRLAMLGSRYAHRPPSQKNGILDIAPYRRTSLA